MEKENKHCEKCRSGYTQSPLKDLCENCSCHKEECNKCDERGMITEVKNGAHYGHSCDCGKYNRLMEERFAGVNIMDLLAYGRRRVDDKKNGRSLSLQATDIIFNPANLN